MQGNHPAFRGTGLVGLVCLVYLVGLVCLVYLVRRSGKGGTSEMRDWLEMLVGLVCLVYLVGTGRRRRGQLQEF